MEDIKVLADAKEKEWNSLFTRMDNDKALLELEPWVMNDKDGKPAAGVLHTTLNDPAMFGAWVNSELLATRETWQIEGDKLNDNATTLIEKWIRDRFIDADNRLKRAGRISFNPYLYSQLCYRGRGITRCITLPDGTLDLLPCDARYVVYDSDYDGLMWIAPWYIKSKAMMAKEYPDYVPSSDKPLKIRGIWYKQKVGDKYRIFNQPYIEDRPYKDKPTEYPDLDYLPFSVQMVQLGSFFNDGDEKRTGESIYWLARDIIPILNEIISIMRSMNFKAYAGAYTFDGGSNKKPPPTPDPGTVTSTDPSQKGYSLIEMQDLQQASIYLLQQIDHRLQAATRSRIEEGVPAFTMSAVGIRDLKAERDKLYKPRLTTMADIKMELASMFTRQAIQIGGDIKVNGKTFKTADLDKDYQTTLEHNTTTPRDEVANWALANAIGNSMSIEDKLRDIAKVDNVGAYMAKLNNERAMASDPSVFFYKIAHDYCDIGDQTGESRYYNMARMFAIRGAAMWKQLLSQGILPDSKNTLDTAGQSGAILPSLLGGSSE